ncbi:glycosyltransferase [Bermanella marisrubri]|uniref:Glycosyltransferase n=1 Tax=Bermanella marisrubri TaxID=207949 RepID=Q1N4G4_9GAMM|nr:glycosyltransferase [Bermanella marisrubri]EAT13139.1 glycosyltransferase [Oceanobacter sp. RED65] [Bermanella marisrubri]QIZ83915.1 glycosyltransferase [Bermanella marisrubri]
MRDLRTEEEIISNWKNGIDKPVVSVCCLTFNHEPYIEDALEGFLIQETDFPFEILIHDDASEDNTANIVRRYQARYPNIIKPIYQTENKYSKGIKINLVYNFSRAKGEYIALCEGDDFWVASDKLKEQITLMKQYPHINISFHPVYQVEGFEFSKAKTLCDYSDVIRQYSPEEVILGGGIFMPTNSLMVKTAILKNLPEWFSTHAPVGDMYIQMIASLGGGAIYMPQKNGAYRTNIPGSWSSMHIKMECQKIEEYANNHIYCFTAFGAENVKFKNEILRALAFELVSCAWNSMKNNCDELAKSLVEKSTSYSECKYINFNQAVLVIFKRNFKILRFLLKLKNRIIA